MKSVGSVLVCAAMTCCVGSSASAAVLVAQYTFDEPSGTTVLDSSGNGRDGTFSTSGVSRTAVTGAPTISSGGNLSGNALNLTGGFVDLSPYADLSRNQSGLSIAAWIKPAALTSSGTRNPVQFRNGNTGSNQVRAGLAIQSSGQLTVRGRSNDSDTLQNLSGPTLTNTDWFHMTGVLDYSTKTFTMYVNGQQVAQNTLGGLNANSTANTASQGFFIGTLAGTSEVYTGLLDDVRIYQGTLTAPEVAAIVPEPGSIAAGAVSAAGLLARRRRGSHR